MKEKDIKDLKTDVKLLLECLEYQRNDVNAVKQGLVTLSTILHDSVEAKDEFQEEGGIEQILSLVTSGKQNDIVEAGLYCLGSAVEKNVYSQKLLSNASVFIFLHDILSAKRGLSGRKKQTVSYLILCLVTNNGFGQNLARQSSCLQDILNLVRSAFPHNGRMDLNFFDGNENSMYDLWTSLLSAACACINNPVNEENQNICASLFPYLFNLLTCQSENQIIRPILLFIGHAVASHSCNQDRIRKCGGIEILVKKLKFLQRQMDSDAGAKLTYVQLLFTLDACISENEASCKRFGELEGIKVVISMLGDCSLDIGDRIQAVLTLAHSVDAYAENEKYIKEGHGITVLIQQLTTSDDEELNKIVKYLLQLCVSKEECLDTVTGNGSHSLLSQMEAMKRLGDMQMLEKISDLDKKLKYLQNRNSVNNCFDDTRESNHSSKYERLEQVGHINDTTKINSSLSNVQEYPETPRERSLLSQLIKEKIERERLEKLNHGLQETLIQNKSAQFQKEGNFVGPDCAVVSRGENDRCVGNECQAVYKERNMLESHNYSTEKSKHPTVETFQHFDYDTKLTAKNQGNLGSCKKPNINKVDKLQENINEDNVNLLQKCFNRHIASSVSQLGSNVRKYSDHSSDDQTMLYTAVPLDLSKSTQLQEVNRINQTLPNDKIKDTGNASNSRSCQGICKTDACNILPMKSTKINRNAEIQCGTPFVLVSDQQSKIDSGIEASSCMSDCSVQTDFVNKPTIRLASSCNDEEKNRSEIMFVASDKRTLSPGNAVHSANGKGPWVCLENSKIVNELINKATASHRDQTQCLSKPSPISSSKSKKSDCFFVKPIARPPKGKVRVTPILGLNSDQGRFSSQHSVKSIQSSTMSSKSDMLSEFDMDLMKNVQKKPGISTNEKCPSKPPVGIVKSQNNVRHIDKFFELQEENAATKWHVQLTTPSRQTAKPVRPAFSDCGTRRYSFTTSSAIKSPVHIKRRSIDDSGIHSPFDELNVMHWGSPIDSDIDGFRSSSDVSDEEISRPSINADVLRSSQKRQNKNDACPGCKSPYIGDLELNSRTYNIILETDSNTCSLHRKIRQFERNHIHKLRESLKLKPKDRILCTKSASVGKKLKSNEHDEFAFTDFESDFEISPISDNNCDTTLSSCKTRKQRRQRIPYTAEEEANILRGVQKLGKYWNQILVTYKFHPSRTNVDLMWKYKRMMSACNQTKASTCKTLQTRNHRPFSMCEERRLRRGIMKFGYNWKTILKSFTFSEGRTTEDLRNKWRSIHGKK